MFVVLVLFFCLAWVSVDSQLSGYHPWRCVCNDLLLVRKTGRFSFWTITNFTQPQPQKPLWSLLSPLYSNKLLLFFFFIWPDTRWHQSHSLFSNWRCNFMVQEVDVMWLTGGKSFSMTHTWLTVGVWAWLIIHKGREISDEWDLSRLRQNSELGWYKGINAQTLPNISAAMTAMTHSRHMVVVFLLCHVWLALSLCIWYLDSCLYKQTN